jgi:energy-coupling factor transporter ATP-binding protein EcfA2
MTDNKRNLPDWLDGFMLLTENSEPPVLFRKWTGISTIAAALQRKVKVDIGISLRFYPNFFVVLVGPSATGKGTAMKYAYDIIEQVPAIRLSAQATSLQALIRRMKETNLTDIDMETGDQIYHSSLTIFSNEFTVFLGYHNRELIAALCDWYDCHNRWTYDTIKRDKEVIVGVWVNILGGTTPDSIQESLPTAAIGTGLTSRIIFVNEDKKDKLVIFPSITQREIDLQQHLIHDLEQIALLSGSFHFTRDAMKFYSAWCHTAEANPPFHDKKFDGYCGRRRNHLLSLAMVCSASRNHSLVLTKDDLERSAILLNEVENKMGLVFRGMGRSDISSLINDAIVFIENSLPDQIPIWQFARYFEGNMDKLSMDRVLTTLEAANYIRIVRRPGMDNMIDILDRSKTKRTGGDNETK